VSGRLQSAAPSSAGCMPARTVTENITYVCVLLFMADIWIAIQYPFIRWAQTQNSWTLPTQLVHGGEQK